MQQEDTTANHGHSPWYPRVTAAGDEFAWFDGREHGLAATEDSAWFMAILPWAERTCYETARLPDPGKQVNVWDVVRGRLAEACMAGLPDDKSNIVAYLLRLVRWRTRDALRSLRARPWEERMAVESADCGLQRDARAVLEPPPEPEDLAVEPTAQEVVARLPVELRQLALLLIAGHTRQSAARVLGVAPCNISRRIHQRLIPALAGAIDPETLARYL